TSLTPDPYAKDSATLTGKYGKDIAKVRLWVNDVAVAQATTSNGDFTFTNIASFIKNKTDKVEVVGVDAQYNELNRKPVTLTGFDTLDNALTAPANFTLDQDTTINGTMGTNVAKVRLSVNGVIVKQATTSAGTYTITGANTYIKSTTDVVKIIAVDAQYKEVNTKTVTVIPNGSIYDYKLDVNAYTFGDATITGTYGKDVTAVRLWVNGAPVKNATLSNGNFTINGLATITKATDKVEVVAVNASFKEVNRKTVQAGE
ncbi:immunoglobulin-like domain-containing protein, partial [Listeria cornellensis]